MISEIKKHTHAANLLFLNYKKKTTHKWTSKKIFSMTTKYF